MKRNKKKLSEREMLSEKKKIQTRTNERKKKKKKEHVFLFEWRMGLGYNFFLRPMIFGGPPWLSCLHSSKTGPAYSPTSL
jgi:hypothetical protein